MTDEIQQSTESTENKLIIPGLPLRDVVVYPHMVIPLFVGRNKSIKALEAAMTKGKQVFLIAQKDASIDDPKSSDLYQIGTISTILQLLKLPDGTVKVLVEGTHRAKIIEVTENEQDRFFMVEYEFLNDIVADESVL